MICQHEKMKSPTRQDFSGEKLYYCPVDCVMGEWGEWSPCPDCVGEESGVYQEDLEHETRFRQRKRKVTNVTPL